MTILVFDIETIPDTQAGRTLYNLEGLSDKDTAEAMFALRRAKSGNDFLPHYLQKICAISIVLSQGNSLKVWSLGDESASEQELIKRFFAGIDKHTPTLVSWNGCGFDLPVYITAPYFTKLAPQPIGRWGKINKISNGITTLVATTIVIST